MLPNSFLTLLPLMLQGDANCNSNLIYIYEITNTVTCSVNGIDHITKSLYTN